MAIKSGGTDRSQPKVPLDIPSRFDNPSKEDTADVFDGLQDSDGEDDFGFHSPTPALLQNVSEIELIDRGRTQSSESECTTPMTCVCRSLPSFSKASLTGVSLPGSSGRPFPMPTRIKSGLTCAKTTTLPFSSARPSSSTTSLPPKKKVLTLGPEEYVVEKAIESAKSLNAFLKALIAATDVLVLAPLRRKSPDNHQHNSKRPKNYPG